MSAMSHVAAMASSGVDRRYRRSSIVSFQLECRLCEQAGPRLPNGRVCVSRSVCRLTRADRADERDEQIDSETSQVCDVARRPRASWACRWTVARPRASRAPSLRASPPATVTLADAKRRSATCPPASTSAWARPIRLDADAACQIHARASLRQARQDRLARFPLSPIWAVQGQATGLRFCGIRAIRCACESFDLARADAAAGCRSSCFGTRWATFARSQNSGRLRSSFVGHRRRNTL